MSDSPSFPTGKDKDSPGKPLKRRQRQRHPRRYGDHGEGPVQLEAELSLPENKEKTEIPYEDMNPLSPPSLGKTLRQWGRVFDRMQRWFGDVSGNLLQGRFADFFFAPALAFLRRHRNAVVLGGTALVLGLGAGMILGVLEKPGIAKAPARASAQGTAQGTNQGTTQETALIYEITPEASDEVSIPMTPDKILEQLRAEGFTLEEPDGTSFSNPSGSGQNAGAGKGTNIAALSPSQSTPSDGPSPPVVTTEYGRVFYPEADIGALPRESVSRPSRKPPRHVPWSGAPEGEGTPPAWRRFAAYSEPVDGRAMISIVIDDLGLNYPRTEQTINLKGPLTLAFLPYGGNLARQTQGALRAGHELMVHLPMEPQDDRFDPGPKALLTGLSQAENLKNLEWNLKRFKGFVGVNNHMGSKFTAYRPGMEAVMREIKKRGLLFLDSRTTGASTGEELATAFGVPHAMRHVFLDNILDPRAIGERLEDLETAAQRQGFAIGICHPHAVTLDVLEKWIGGLDRRRYVLVPLSAIVEKRREMILQQAKAVLP